MQEALLPRAVILEKRVPSVENNVKFKRKRSFKSRKTDVFYCDWGKMLSFSPMFYTIDK